MKLTKVVVLSVAAVLVTACSGDGVRHTPDAEETTTDAAVDAALPDAPLDPAALAVSPDGTDFGDVVLGQTTSKVTYTVSNRGEQLSGPVSVTLEPTTGGFTLSDNTCGAAGLGKYDTCTFAVAWTPGAAGTDMAQLHIAATPGGDVTPAVKGTGLTPGALDITEASHDFTKLALGAAPTTHTFTVRNTGQVATGIPMPSITGTASTYSVQSTTCTTALAPSATCNVVVKFAPTTVGSKPATLVVTGTPGGSDSATLSGVGVAHVAITKTGNGTGTVTSNMTGIDCGSACTADFSATPVTLAATPDTGVNFGGWTGGCTGLSPCTLDLTEGKAVGAIFTKQRFALTTSTTGNGSGTVTLSPAGGTYDYGTMVTVTATPATGSTFTGWGGDCSGTGACTVTMTQARNVTAAFTLKQFTLTTSTNGAGTGTVGGAGTYDYGTVVTVTNSPGTGSTFGGWGGDCTGTGACTVTMTANHAVSATFNLQQFTLTTSKTGNGTGSVGGAGTYDYGTVVTVTESPGTGSTFSGWGGDCSGTGACTVTMTANHSVSASFTLQRFTLSTSTTGSGTGTVNGGGTYDYGTVVTVTESPGTGSTFGGWSGDCSGTGACTVTMTANHTVSAAFNLQRFTLTTSKTGNGTGSVSGAGTYNYGTVVTVTASPGTGSSFTGFGGDCSGTTCTVTMTANHAVSASFTLQTFTLSTSKTGNGTGSITGAGTYNYGTVVNVTATAGTGSTFTGFGGDCSGSTCSVTMTANHAVSASFTLQQFTLSTSTNGAGSGTVGGAGTYNYGTVVTVTESPSTGSTFGGWGGDCSGTGACTVTMTANHAVSATFNVQQLTLTTSANGTGTGSITGAGTYPYGTVVNLTATPGTGSTFGGWGGDCSGTGGCSVTMTTDHAVSATFTAIPETLTVTTAAAGGAIVTSPAGINCRQATCAHDFDYGTPVVVSANIDTGYRVSAVVGAGCTSLPCTVTMTQAQSLTVRFSPIQYKLALTIDGDAPGTVTVNGTTYQASTTIAVSYGQQVTLTEAHTSDWLFGAWGGACSSYPRTSATCTVNITGDTAVEATFRSVSENIALVATTQTANAAPFSVTYPLSVTTNAECQSTAAGTNCTAGGYTFVQQTFTAHAPPATSHQYQWVHLPTWTGCDSVSADRLTCTYTITGPGHVITVTGDMQ